MAEFQASASELLSRKSRLLEAAAYFAALVSPLFPNSPLERRKEGREMAHAGQRSLSFWSS